MRKKIKKHCISCGQRFLAYSKLHKYCSYKCSPNIYKRKNKNQYKIPNELTPELANVYGHLISDGGIYIKEVYKGYDYPKSHFATYSNTDKELVLEFVNNFKKVFEKELNLHLYIPKNKKHKKAWHINFGIIKIVEFLNNFKVDNIINSNNLEIKKQFLRACFDDEGNVGAGVNICQKDKKYIDNIEKLLRDLGFTYIKRYEIFNKKYSKSYYCLRVNTPDFELYLNKIGFISINKQNKLIERIKIYNNYMKKK